MDVIPGSQVMVWNAQRGGIQPSKRGSKTWKPDSRAWHGPGVVVSHDGPGGCWAPLQGQFHRVPMEYLRMATTENIKSFQLVMEELQSQSKDMDLSGKGVKGYRDWRRRRDGQLNL